jgi:hypothetical protein
VYCSSLFGQRFLISLDFFPKELHDKQAEKLLEREQKKKEAKEKRKKSLDKKHTFHDKKYEEQKQKISEDLDTVLTETLAKQSQKRKLETNTDVVETKRDQKPDEKKDDGLNKMKGWLGVDDLDVSSDSCDDDQSINNNKKAKSS